MHVLQISAGVPSSPVNFVIVANATVCITSNEGGLTATGVSISEKKKISGVPHDCGVCSNLNYLLIVFHLLNFFILLSSALYSTFVIYSPYWRYVLVISVHLIGDIWSSFLLSVYLFFYLFKSSVIHSPYIVLCP